MHTLPTPSFHHSLSSPRRTKKKTSHPVRPRPHRPTSPSCSSSSPSPLHPSLASAPHPFPPTRRPRSPPRPLPPLAVSPSVPHILHARARSRAARRTSLARRAGHNLPCVRSALPSPSPSCRRSLSLPPASPPFPSSAAPLHQRHLSRPVVSRLRFASSSNNLMASSWDSGLRLYDVDSFALRLEAKSEAAPLDCCFEDEAVALAGCSDGSVIRYDLHSGLQETVGLHDDVVACIEFSQNTGQIVTASLDKKLLFWDTHTRSVSPNSIITFSSDVASLSVCDMYILAAVERDVYFYDMRNLTRPVKAKDSPVEYHIRCLHASPEWNGYATGSVDGAVALKYFDCRTDGDTGYVFRCHPKSRDGRSSLVPINSIAIHPCKRTFVTGDNEGHAIAWDAQSKKKLLEFPKYSGSVASIAYNHSGQLLAVASNYTYQEEDKVVERHQIFVETVQNFKGKFTLE